MEIKTLKARAICLGCYPYPNHNIYLYQDIDGTYYNANQQQCKALKCTTIADVLATFFKPELQKQLV